MLTARRFFNNREDGIVEETSAMNINEMVDYCIISRR
jgi:hypothetical protein